MDRLLLVDGSNLLFQMFYGMPARIPGRDGRPVHGTLGFTGALLRVLRMRVPTHCVVFFDGEHENPRKALDEAYKANRPDFSHMEEQETPFGQLPDINRVLEYLGIPRMETTDCETDDLIAAYARRMGEKMYVDILSYDSDFFSSCPTGSRSSGIGASLQSAGIQTRFGKSSALNRNSMQISNLLQGMLPITFAERNGWVPRRLQNCCGSTERWKPF